jgi:predicted ester cyclase
MPETVESTKKFFGMLLSAFPDYHTHVETTVAEGDYVFQRTMTTGTMKGEFLGMKPTGKQATWQEMHLVRFANGKVVEHWANIDQTSMMVQLGLMPAP